MLLFCSCNDAKPNILRLAGDLAAIEGQRNVGDHGIPAVRGMRVGIVDCTDAVIAEICRQLGPSVSAVEVLWPFGFR